MTTITKTIKVEGVEFECIGEYYEPDTSVGYYGGFDMEDVKVNGESMINFLDSKFLDYLQNEAGYALSDPYSR